MRHTIHKYNLAAFLLILLAGGLRADTIISVQFEGTNGPTNFQGPEADATAADAAFANSDQWNYLQAGNNQIFSNLITSTGASSGASLSIQYVSGYNTGSHTLPDTYFLISTTAARAHRFQYPGWLPMKVSRCSFTLTTQCTRRTTGE